MLLKVTFSKKKYIAESGAQLHGKGFTGNRGRIHWKISARWSMLLKVELNYMVKGSSEMGKDSLENISKMEYVAESNSKKKYIAKSGAAFQRVEYPVQLSAT
ncbi:hypothetical protein SLEP1_g39655 [Rubroshorea leprosula]|uniref:Uncharacterized protein n=1 Tax=Rubroshorea leprosula TaxID=152421 RepID=A0AAV5L139_9ROSI|nr:hypothetical protein SLEP1_g39655 [Rubroshorea leprosula]